MRPIPDAQRWSQVCRLFEELVDLKEAARAMRLDDIGASDPELRDSVQQLLDADSRADARLANLERALISAPSREPDSNVADTLKLVGRTISRFQVIAPLARGGMGVVYRGEDTLLRRSVALKFPLPSQQLESRAKERFLHEARTAGSLDHPNLCRIHEIGETDTGELFIAMPLYDGETLKARIARVAPLPVDEALDLARQIARGLAAAHTAGVVHRDLKPANIMLLPDGTLKILDFGLAKIDDVTLTASHARIGTVSYMAPEQISSGVVDTRADLWSLGVVLFEMLTGRRPFVGEHDVSVAHAIVHDAPALPSTLRRELPRVIEDLVVALLQKNPANRPHGMAQVEAELERIQIGKPLPVLMRWRRRTRASYQRLRSQPRRFAIATFAFAFLILAGAGWLARGLLRPAAARTIDHSVAVLPFANPSNQSGVEYLSVGLLDGLINQLRAVKDIRVTSRQTALSYRASTKSIQQIANELEVATVLQGKIERVGNRIRVSAKLVNAKTSEPLWSNEFERSPADILAVQEEVARGVARTMGVAVSRAEESELRQRPTSNAAAYDLYLRGHEYELRIPSPEGQRAAETLYGQALALDSTFALARARRATVGIDIYLNLFDRHPQRLERGRRDAEAALRMQPKLAEAHNALGWYWTARSDHNRALEYFQTAVRWAPNNAEAHASLGYALRNLGRDDEATAALERSLALDPADVRTAWALAGVHRAGRRYMEAIKYENYVIDRAPDGYMHMLTKGTNYVYWKGTTDTLAAMIERVPRSWNNAAALTRARLLLARMQRKPADALAALNEASDAEINQFRPSTILKAQAAEAAGDRVRARPLFEAARRAWQDSVAAHPNNPQMKALLAACYAGLDRAAEAERLARQAVDAAIGVSRDNPNRNVLIMAAETYARTGNADAAVELLERLMRGPGGYVISASMLRMDPLWDPIRATPAFRQLLARYSAN